VRRTFVRYWSADPGLSALLLALVVTIFVLRPLVGLSGAGRVLIEVWFAFVLLAGVWTVWGHRRQAIVLTVVIVIAELVRWLHTQMPAAGLAPWEALSGAVAFGILVFLVLNRVFRAGPITVQRIEGAVAVYLLFGLVWAEVYQFVELLNPGAFQIPSGAAGASDRFSSLLYFSFITLTTLGYGDIVPVHPVARSLAMLEALTGQLYPAILIARLVSMEIASKGGQPS
jgi:voltage-gated potassium channel Kch